MEKEEEEEENSFVKWNKYTGRWQISLDPVYFESSLALSIVH